LGFLGDALLHLLALSLYDSAEANGFSPGRSFFVSGFCYGRVGFCLQGRALLLDRHLQVHCLEVHHL